MKQKKMWFGIVAVAVIAVAVFIMFTHKKQSSPQSFSPGKTVNVEITTTGFNPESVQIEQGDTVRWINHDSLPRWPASDPHPTHDGYPGFDPEREIAPGQTWQFTFTKIGQWGYHDHLSPHRRGMIVVIAKTDAVLPPEIQQLLAEKDTAKQATIVHAMAEKYGPKETLDFMNRAGLPFTGETHLLVHEIGNVAYEKYGDRALLYCNESFLSACYHGVIINALGDHGMAGVVKTIDQCKQGGYGVLSQCAHAAGHGFLAWKDYHVTEALASCDALHGLDTSIPVFNCYDGTFMENVFGVHEGKPSVNRLFKASDPYYPCDAMPIRYQGGCWSNQATIMYQIYKGDFKKIAQGCDGVKNVEFQKICYNNFARQIHPVTKGDATIAIELCKNATGHWQDDCLISIVSAAFSVGDYAGMPYGLCPAVQSSSEKTRCYQTMFANIDSYAKSPEQKLSWCVYIREQDAKVQCTNKFAVR